MRKIFVPAGLLLTVWFFLGSPVAALPPSTHLDQLHHKAWTIEDGAPADVWALDQGPDGYLWLGTGAGLYRFDGAEFERIAPSRGDHFPSIDITALHATQSGDLWIGYSSGGISRLHDDELVNYPVEGVATPWMVLRFVEDGNGVVWAATAGGLMRFDGQRWRLVGKDWNYPSDKAYWIARVSDGSLWVSDGETIRYLDPGSHAFQSIGVKTGRAVFAEGKHHRIWVLDSYRGLISIAIATHAANGNLPLIPEKPRFSPNYIVIDQDGAVWGTDLSRGGAFRIGNPMQIADRGVATFKNNLERFGIADGLSSDISVPLLMDKTDQLWLGTNRGLDRLSRQFFVTETWVPSTSHFGYAAAFSAAGEYILDSKSIYRLGGGRDLVKVANMPGDLACARIDEHGILWIGVEQGLWRYDGRDGPEKVELPPDVGPQTRIGALAEDAAGALWALMPGKGVYRLLDGKWAPFVLPASFGSATPVGMFSGPGGTIWMDLQNGRLLRISGSGQHLFSRQTGPGIGEILGVSRVGGRTVLMGAFGLARLEGDDFSVISDTQIPAARGVTGVAVSPDGLVWLNTISGVVRLSAAELDAAFADPGYHPVFALFTARDGLPGVAQQAKFQTISLSQDGRIWFTTNHGVAWHDLAFEGITPPKVPVRLKAITANGLLLKPSSGMKLPENTSQLSLSYRALNLFSPERTLFRYRLGGADQRWVDVGTSRLIQFSNLGPGQYSIDIEATGEPGVWRGAAMHFSFDIPPTFVQSRQFLFLCIVTALGLGLLLYLYHLRQVSERIKSRMEERLSERERIARELHDTLLQGLQGLLLRFQSVLERLPRDSESHAALEAALERADDVLQEGRDRVRVLRSDECPVDLERHLSKIATDILDQQVPWRLESMGASRPVAAHAAEDIAGIVSESLSNALRHAHAQTIVVRLTFGRREVTISVVDDGVGMDAEIREKGQRDGHYGLVGMRERAEKLRAKLKINDMEPAGTEICLVVSGKAAFA